MIGSRVGPVPLPIPTHAGRRARTGPWESVRSRIEGLPEWPATTRFLNGHGVLRPFDRRRVQVARSSLRSLTESSLPPTLRLSSSGWRPLRRPCGVAARLLARQADRYDRCHGPDALGCSLADDPHGVLQTRERPVSAPAMGEGSPGRRTIASLPILRPLCFRTFRRTSSGAERRSRSHDRSVTLSRGPRQRHRDLGSEVSRQAQGNDGAGCGGSPPFASSLRGYRGTETRALPITTTEGRSSRDMRCSPSWESSEARLKPPASGRSWNIRSSRPENDQTRSRHALVSSRVGVRAVSTPGSLPRLRPCLSRTV